MNHIKDGIWDFLEIVVGTGAVIVICDLFDILP